MTQRNREQIVRQFKLSFMMYLGALAFYSYWSQNLDGEVKPESFSQEMDGWNSYRHQTNVQTGDAATGVLQTSNAQRFIAVKTVPEWANNIK